MSSYHRKLVYDLVREEFPGYRCAGRDGGSFMQITKVGDTVQRQVSLEPVAQVILFGKFPYLLQIHHSDNLLILCVSRGLSS